jgi:HEAT repeat protein
VTTHPDLVAQVHAFGEALNADVTLAPDLLPRLVLLLEETMGGREADPDLLDELVWAIGWARAPEGSEALLRLVPLDHPADCVREALVHSLAMGVDADSACYPAVVSALCALSSDPLTEVRDWACFGLGILHADTAEAREALAARLDDPDEETRYEALSALALSGDDRAFTAVARRLAGDPGLLWELAIEAAAHLADPRLHPDLLRVQADGEQNHWSFVSSVATALARCRPEAAAVDEQRVAAELRARLPGHLTTYLTGNYPRTVLRVTEDGVEISTNGDGRLWDDMEPGGYPVELAVSRILEAVTAATDCAAPSGG